MPETTDPQPKQCPACQHPQHQPGTECEEAIDHGPKRWHRCLCLNRPNAARACSPLMDCQGGKLGYGDIWYLQQGRSLQGVDGAIITPDVLAAPAAVPSASAAPAALLGAAADRFEERAATLTDGIDDLAAFVAKARMRDAEVWKAAATLLRAMADCPACEAGIEHTVHCPTPETHNWGCGCPSDVTAAIASCPGHEMSPSPCRCPCYGCKHHCGAHNPDSETGPSRVAGEAQQPTSLAETIAAKRQEPAFVQLAEAWSTDGGLIDQAQQPERQAQPAGSAAIRRKLRRWAYAAGHIESELDSAVDRMYAAIAQDIARGPAAEQPAAVSQPVEEA